MKKYLIPATVCILIGGILLSGFSAKQEEKQAMETVIRLHVRAADDSDEEQALKLKVRDEILQQTTEILRDCEEKKDAKNILKESLPLLEQVGKNTVLTEGKNHSVSVSIQRETFEYREYDGFFLPEGEYDSLVVTIGPGEGKNWWCVVFPAACYMGAADVETDEQKMPSCFRLAKTPARNVTVKFWLWEKIKNLFD